MDDMPPVVAEFLIEVAVEAEKKLIVLGKDVYRPTSRHTVHHNNYSLVFEIHRVRMSENVFAQMIKCEIYRTGTGYPICQGMKHPFQLKNSDYLAKYGELLGSNIFKEVRIRAPLEGEGHFPFRGRFEASKKVIFDFLVKHNVRCVTLFYSTRDWFLKFIEVLKPLRIVHVQGMNNISEFLSPIMHQDIPKVFTLFIRQFLDIPNIMQAMKKYEHIELAVLGVSDSDHQLVTNLLDLYRPCRMETTTQFCLHNLNLLIQLIETYLNTQEAPMTTTYGFRFVVKDNKIPLGYRPTNNDEIHATYTNAILYNEQFAEWRLPNRRHDVKFAQIPHTVGFHKVARHTFPLVIITVMKAIPLGLTEFGTEVIISISQCTSFSQFMDFYLACINEVGDFNTNSMFCHSLNNERTSIAILYANLRTQQNAQI